MAGAEVIAVIGLGASIIQVVDGCNKILNRVQAFRKNMAFQDIELQLPLLMKDIENLNSPEYRELIDEATERALARVLEGCRRQISALDQLIQYLTPEITASKLQRTWKGFKSFGKDTKLREILGILSEYKATITLHLSSRQMHISRRGVTDEKLSKSYFEVPAQRVSHFVGRKLVLDKIKNIISTSDVQPAVVVLTAVGGQGKTQIALEFCHESVSSFNAIFWIDASSRTSATRSFENIAPKIGSSRQSFSDPTSFVKESLRDWPLPWLLIFDNYDDPRTFDDVKSFFPTSNGSNKNAILITSRNTLPERLGVAIKLGGLAEEESLELLRSRCAVGGTNEDDAEEGKKIVGKLGYLPLAIDQAAAYISIRQLPFVLFLEHYEKRKDVILNHTPASLWEYRTKGVDAVTSELNMSVLTTWELSFEQIGSDEHERRRIGNFLTQSAFFNPSCINESFFRCFSVSCRRYGDSLPGWFDVFMTSDVWDPFRFQDTVVGLMSLSLIQSVEITSSGTKFSLHPLIKDWLQLRNSIPERCRCTSIAISVTAYFLQDQDVEVISLQSRQESLATIDTCMQNYHEFCESTSDKRKFGGLVEGLQTTFATFYGRHDRYDDAEKLFLESLEWQKRELGQLNLSTLRTANNLAAMYLDQRQLEKAETLLIQTVALKETLLGRDNPITLNTVNNLGNLYAMQSFFDQAQQMYTRTLETYSAIYGETHKTVLEAQNNLGEVAMKMGHFQKAETWFKTALAPLRGSKETGLTLYIKSNIAVIYKLQGRHSDAIALYEEVIRGRETLLGPDHSSTLISMCELGDVYVACGQREKADEWYSRGKANKFRRNKGILEVKTSDERPAPGIATTLSHDLVSQGATSETAPSYDRIKWDGPEKPQSEIARSGRALQNRLAQQTFRKRMRQKRSGWASMNDGILTPEQKQLLMTRSMASEPLINPKTRESFTGPATDFSEEDFWAFPEGSILDSESVEASKDLVHDNQDSNFLPQRFHRLHIYNPDVDDDMPVDENSEQISRLEPTLEPSGDTPDRRGRARRNKMLALSRMSRIFLDAQKETPEQSNILPKTTLPDPTVPAEAQSRSFTHSSPRSNLGQNQAGPIDERQVPSRSGSRHANQWHFSSLSIRAAVEALPKRHGDEGTTMGLKITANRPMDVDRLDVNMNNPQNSFNRHGLNVTNWPISDAEDFEMLDKTLGIPRSRPNFASNYENNVSGSSREALPVMTYLNSPLRPEQPREFLPTSSDEAHPSKDPVQSEEISTLQRPPSPLGSVAPVVRDAKGQIDVLDRSGLMRENVTRVISRPPNYGSDRFHKMSSWNDIPEGIVKPPNWDLEVINPSKSKLPPPTLSTTGGSNQSNIPTDIRSALLTDADQGGANQLNPTATVAPPPTKNPGTGSINPYAPDIQRVPDTSALQQGSRSETRWKAGRRTRADDVIPWEYSR